jgi:hypothetical protein
MHYYKTADFHGDAVRAGEIICPDFNMYVGIQLIIPFLLWQAKAIPVTGRGRLQGCEMLRIPHCLENWLTDGGKVVSPTHRPQLTPQKHYYFSVSGTHFC